MATGLIKSPGVTGKSERAGHNSVALPTAAGRREGDRICPALTDFPVTPGDIHSTARPFLMADGLFGHAALHCQLYVTFFDGPRTFLTTDGLF